MDFPWLAILIALLKCVFSLAFVMQIVPILRRVAACRDPRDDKFLDVALAGEAAAIISGDKDLLVLTPWHGIPILTPAEFLMR